MQPAAPGWILLPGLDPPSRAGSCFQAYASLRWQGKGRSAAAQRPSPVTHLPGKPRPRCTSHRAPSGCLALGTRLHIPQGTSACPRTALKGCEDGIWASDMPKVPAKLGLDTGLILAPNPAPGALPQLQKHQQKQRRSQSLPFSPPITKDQEWRRWARRLNKAPRNEGALLNVVYFSPQFARFFYQVCNSGSQTATHAAS